MSTRPYFFQRINDIYLLTKYQNIKSKLPKLKMEHQEVLKKKVYKMIMNQSYKDVIECDHEIVMKIAKSPQSQKKMDIIFHYQYPLDKNDGYSIICKQAEFPNINVSVRRQTLSKEDSSKIHLQLYLCQFCQSQKNDSSFFKIIFGGLSGLTHFLIGQEQIFSFQKIKILKSSKGKSPLHIMMALYQQNGNRRTWLDFYTSQPLFVTEDANILLLNNKESIIKYMEQFEIENVSSPRKFHIYSNQNQQIFALENHITNRSPKILNLLYLAYKFSQTCEIYFQRDPINIPQIQQFNTVSQNWPQISPKKLSCFQNIINILIEVKAKIQQNESQGEDAKLVCNHLNPKSSIVFRILKPLHKVRFILAEQFTDHICIVNGIEYDLSSFRKLQTSDIKNVYKMYLNTTKKTQKHILNAKGKSNYIGSGIQSDSKQNNNFQDGSQDSNDECKHKTPVKIHKTRASSKKGVQKNENHYSLEQKAFHQPLKEFQQKRVYQADMKKMTQLSKKEKLEVKKREKQQTKDVYQTFEQKASNFQQNSIKSQEQNKKTKCIQNKRFSFYKAYQITYFFNEHNSTTTFDLDNSLFIDNKSNYRRYRQPLPAYIYDYPQYIPYPHEIRYIKPRFAEHEASFDHHSSCTQGEPPLFFNRVYPRGYFYESPPRRYKNHRFYPYQQQFQKDYEEQQSGKKSYSRLYYERQKSKYSK